MSRAIYVGGVSQRYGTDIMLQALEDVNRDCGLELQMVCREGENTCLYDGYKQVSWLKVIHESSDNLQRYYKESGFGIVPIRKDKYNDFSFPIKLFEYISYGLPVIVTDCNEMASFVKKYNIGLVVKDDKDSLASAVRKMLCSREKYLIYKENLRICLNENSWISRARKVKDELCRTK
jgi:glycosyltransferase involved in cell wall biosynthesis